jgi:hypothetical protein
MRKACSKSNSLLIFASVRGSLDGFSAHWGGLLLQCIECSPATSYTAVATRVFTSPQIVTNLSRITRFFIMTGSSSDKAPRASQGMSPRQPSNLASQSAPSNSVSIDARLLRENPASCHRSRPNMNETFKQVLRSGIHYAHRRATALVSLRLADQS